MKLKNFLLIAGLVSGVSSAQAMSLDWTGGYRLEWNQVSKPTLGSPSGSKEYGTNYLYLSPKIIAADGVNIVTRFDIFNSQTEAYQGSQLGDIWGLNTNGGTNGTSGAVSSNNGAASFSVSQLYLNVNQEFGTLVAGRVPFEFGMGMTHNAGKGLFDHWYDSRDMVAYKVIVGDWSFTPMIGRVKSTDYGQGGAMSSQAFMLQYENVETKTLLGFMQDNRKGSQDLNDIAAHIGTGTEYTTSGEFSLQTTSFVFGRGFDGFNFKVEAAFQSGSAGVTQASSGEEAAISGYGVAAEFNFPRPESKWNWNMKLGMASGDDPETADLEGFAFDRNYDVAMLLFNHRLGQHDYFGTNIYKSATGLDVRNSADDEQISNAFYIAPTINYAWNERFDVKNTLIYAQLLKPFDSSVASTKDLGLEWDISLVYKPSEKIQWLNGLGMLFPGGAWKNGTEDLENSFTYGFTSKAAISF
jgi:hypothetical protein